MWMVGLQKAWALGGSAAMSQVLTFTPNLDMSPWAEDIFQVGSFPKRRKVK